MTNLSRREVLAGLAVATALAAVPVTAAPISEALAPAALPIEPARGWWGYSLDGDYWNGPFGSREEALAEAQNDYPDEACTTGLCIPHEMEAPDLREICVLWLNDGCTKRSLYRDVCQSFEGANEDHDYEGEVGEELAAADWKPLLADLKDVLAVALFRHARPDLIPAVMVGDRVEAPLVSDDLDPLLDALENDAQFEADLTAAAEVWMVAQNLKTAPRRVDLENEQHHDALEVLGEK